LEASPERLVESISARWDIEDPFANSKEKLGLNQYQLVRAMALVRFWCLALHISIFLDEERLHLQ
jgi:hypothetical protein